MSTFGDVVSGYSDLIERGIESRTAATLLVAMSLDHVASAIHRLGTADAATPMGAIEMLSMEIKRIADVLQEKD